MADFVLEDNLFTFIKEFADDLNSLELLLFFSRHPNARFNRTAIIHAVNSRKFESSVALKKLIEKQIIITTFENGVYLYSLTHDEPVYSLAGRLVKIDQGQWQVILECILDAQGID